MRRDMKSILVQSPQEGELYGFKVHNFSLYVGESINEMKVLAATSIDVGELKCLGGLSLKMP